MSVIWPPADLQAKREGESYYQGAAVCRRGHVVTTQYVEDGKRAGQRPSDKCTKCGARVLLACPQCQLRIRGTMYVPMVVGFANQYTRPSFCDGCGAAYPWATREERVYELENLLDEEEIDEASRVVIQDHLHRLRSDELNDKEAEKAWKGIRDAAGSALRSGPVQRVLEGLVTAALRNQLGI